MSGCSRPGRDAGGAVQACERIEIVDRDTGDVISGGTTNRIVGKKIKLQVRTHPAGLAMTNIHWTIPNERVKNYTQSADAATRTELANADLSAASLDFYWINGGNKNVQVSADVNGITYRKAAVVNVLAPTAVTMPSVTGAVGVGDPGFGGGGIELHYGRSGAVGIRWTLTCTAPAGGAGQIAGTQLNRSHRTRTANNRTVQVNSTNGTWQLDTSVPYSAAVAIAAGAGATWTGNDTPGTPLTQAYRQKTVDDRFRIYFMYKPSGADSIWVTIMRLDWDWQASTTRVGAPDSAENNWNAPTGVSNTVNPSGGASMELPTWTANVRDIVWQAPPP